jgi:hypothetical protein
MTARARWRRPFSSDASASGPAFSLSALPNCQAARSRPSIPLPRVLGPVTLFHASALDRIRPHRRRERRESARAIHHLALGSTPGVRRRSSIAADTSIAVRPGATPSGPSPRPPEMAKSFGIVVRCRGTNTPCGTVPRVVHGSSSSAGTVRNRMAGRSTLTVSTPSESIV